MDIKDLNDRIKVYALQAQLQIQILRKFQSLKEYGFTTYEQSSWFVFLVLCYIMEQSLELPHSDGLDLETIAWTLQNMLKEHFSLIIDEKQSMQLARLVVVEILCNNGAPLTFNSEASHMKSVPLGFLESPTVTRHGVRRGVYRMATDGYRLVLATREMEENMKITVNAIIVEMEMKSRNYAGALRQVEEQMDLLQIQQIKVQGYIAQIKADVLSITKEEADKIYHENTEVLEISRSKFSEVRQTVNLQIEDARAQMRAGDVSEELQDTLTLLNELYKQLSLSINLMGGIISALFDFHNTRAAELLAQMGANNFLRHSLRKDVFEAVIQNPDGMEHLYDFIKPLLFASSLPQTWQLEKLFMLKSSLRKEEEEDLEYSEEDEEASLMAEQQERLEVVSLLHQLFYEFIMDVYDTPSHSLDLKTFIETNPLVQSISDVSVMKEFLSSFALIQKLDIQDSLQTAHLFVEGTQSLFSIGLSYIEAVKENENLRHFSTLTVDKTDGQLVWKSRPDKGIVQQLSMDNVLVLLERPKL